MRLPFELTALRHKLAVVGAGLGVFALVSWLLVFGVRRPRPRPMVQLPARAGGVTLAQLREAVQGSEAVAGGEGDWLLSSDRIRLVVGSDAAGVDRQLGFGALLDLAPKSFDDDVLWHMRPVVWAEGAEVPLRVDAVLPVQLSSRPTLRIVQSSSDGRLLLSTEVRLVPGKPVVELVTRAENTGQSPLRLVRVGDRVRWPGGYTFAPRLGYVRFTSREEVPWIGRHGTALSYALAFPDGPTEVSFAFDRVGPTSQTALARGVPLSPGATHEVRRSLIAAPGALGRAAAEAWRVLGRQVGWIHGTLRPAPAWAQIEAQHADGRPLLAVTAGADGSYELAVPPGQYRLLLRAPGGEDDALVRVEADQKVESHLLAPEPGQLRYSAVDDLGRPVPARLLVRGLGNTKNPDFGPIETLAGARFAAYTRTGEGMIELPAGRYRITATHGPEFGLHEEAFEVTAARGATVRATLRRRVDTPGWLACDFHLHAAPSPDSSMPLEDRVVSLLAEGLDFVVATDHNHVTDYEPFVRRLKAHEELAATTGVEITTAAWGHFIAFPYPKKAFIPPFVGVEPPEIFSTVRARAPGAVVQVNHPRMPGMGYFNRMDLDPATGVAAGEGFSFDFDTIEVTNGFELGDPKRLESNIQEWFSLLNFGRRYTAVGNSDSHRLAFQWAGWPRTYVRVVDDRAVAASAGEVARSLLAGRAFVSNGPFVQALVDGIAGPGETLRPEQDSVTLQVSVRAPRWIDVTRAEAWVNGALVASTNRVIPGDSVVRIQWERVLRFEKDSWIVVIVRGERPLDIVLPGARAKPFAFTNPIFVDVDRDGTFRAPGPLVDAGVEKP